MVSDGVRGWLWPSGTQGLALQHIASHNSPDGRQVVTKMRCNFPVTICSNLVYRNDCGI